MSKKREQTPNAEKANPIESVSLYPLTQEIYTTHEIAEMLRVTDRMVRYWILGRGTRRRLKAFRCGKILRVRREDLKIFIETHCEEPESLRAKYRTNPTSRRVGKTIRQSQQQDAKAVLRELKVIK